MTTTTLPKAIRRHMCDKCHNNLFDCNECTEALHKSQLQRAHYLYGTVLYSNRHRPHGGIGHKSEWLCGPCKRKTR